MSISVSLSQKERRLGLCLLPPLVNLDFGCSCGLCRFLTPVSCPCCCCHVLCCCLDPRPFAFASAVPAGERSSLLGGSCCCLSLNSPHSWHALKSLKSPKLSTSLTFGWLEKRTPHSFSNWILPDLDVKELCLESPLGLGAEYPRFLAGVWPDFNAIGLLHVLPFDEKRTQR